MAVSPVGGFCVARMDASIPPSLAAVSLYGEQSGHNLLVVGLPRQLSIRGKRARMGEGV